MARYYSHLRRLVGEEAASRQFEQAKADEPVADVKEVELSDVINGLELLEKAEQAGASIRQLLVAWGKPLMDWDGSSHHAENILRQFEAQQWERDNWLTLSKAEATNLMTMLSDSLKQMYDTGVRLNKMADETVSGTNDGDANAEQQLRKASLQYYASLVKLFDVVYYNQACSPSGATSLLLAHASDIALYPNGELAHARMRNLR